MPRPLRVLIVEDCLQDADLFVCELRRVGFDPEWRRVETEAEYVASLGPGFDVILADYAMPHFSGIRALELLQERGLEIPFILISGIISEEAAVELVKMGAEDYLLKDRLARIGPAIERALRQGQVSQERKRVENALRASEERFRQVTEAIEQVFWMTDVDKNEMLYISPSYERIWGRTCQSLYDSPRNWLDAIHPEDRQRVLDAALTTQTTGDYSLEYRIMRPDGTERWIYDRAFPVRDAAGKVHRIAGVADDITEAKRSEETLQNRTRQQQALAELGQHALEGRDLATLLDDAVALVPQILGIEFCKVLELMPGEKTLLLRAGAGWNAGLVGSEILPAGGDSQAGFTLLSSAPVVVDDLRSETRFHVPALMLDHGIVSGMSAIIHGRSRPYGVLSAHTSRHRKFSTDDVFFLQSVANVLAAAIERRELEDELLNISDREQQRIGQDLHDGLCQRLAGIKFVTELVARDLPENLVAKEKIAKVGEDIRETILQTRMLARALSPVQLETNGLMSALEELTSTTEQLFNIACRFDCEPPVLVQDNATATHLYRIAQESIRNAIEHGQATHVTVTLSSSGDHATLAIADDGSGFQTESRSGSGMGLHIMNYRAGMIGGRLSIKPRNEKGTTVSCSWKI